MRLGLITAAVGLVTPSASLLAMSCSASRAVLEASAPQVGTGEHGSAARPATLAAAKAQYAETVRKCGELTVAAVRVECLRQARRVLELESARLRAAGAPAAAGR
jgi:hypothetical protein